MDIKSQIKLSILITGASTGIGLDASIKLASRGHQVYAGARKQEDFDKLEALHENIQPVYLDITNEDQIKEFISNCQSLDILINNAGIAVGGPLELIPITEIQKQFEVNVTSHLRMTQSALELLRKSRNPKGARVIFIGSQSGYLTRPFTGIYSASKFAIEAICDALRIELGLFGIKVSLIQPGVIKTPIWKKSIGKALDLKHNYDPNRVHYYQDILDMVANATQQIANKGTDVSQVTKALIHSVEANTPRIRYRVGRDAQINYLISWLLPYSLRDWIMRKVLAKKLKSQKRINQ